MNDGAQTLVTYSLSSDIQFDVKSDTKTSAASQTNILWYGVYHKKENGNYVYMSDMSAFVQIDDPSDITVPVTLIQDQEYRIVFVAQHRIENSGQEYKYMYNVDPQTGEMSRNTDATATDGEQLDVFVYVDSITTIRRELNRSITLQRPVAQINIATSQALPTTMEIKLSKVAKSYNVFEKTFSSERINLTFNNMAVSREQLKVEEIQYNKLTSLYVLGGYNIDMEISCDGQTKTISNISIAPNYKTNIVGKI